MPVPPAVLELMILAAQMPANEFVKEHVLTGQSAVCTESEYAALRAEIADRLAMTPDSLRLIGSAKLGFSLNADHWTLSIWPNSL